jgi:hypothetical protein
LERTRLRGRPRNRWQDEVKEDGRIVGGEGWQEKVHNREEWKRLLTMARNHRILHMPMEWLNEWMNLTRKTEFTKPLKTAVLLMGESQVEHIWKKLWAVEIRPMVCGLLNTAVQYQTHLKAEVVHNFV